MPEPHPSPPPVFLIPHSAFRTLHLGGASGRTRTDEYEFTKLVLWLLRHRGKVASTAGLAPATSTFARWRSNLTELRGRSKCKMESAKCRILPLSELMHSPLSTLHLIGPRGWYRANVSSSSARR